MKKNSASFYILIVCVFASLFLLCGCQKNSEISIVTVTDTHFAGRSSHSYEGEYLEANDTNGSGKQMRYLDDIVDAFIDQMKEEEPEYVLITGDLSYNGAKASHTEFAEKLRALKDAGVTVLVVPGNHDIVSYAFTFPEGEAVESGPTTPEDFTEIYADFGYSGALSYDENSLSYVYDTGKGARIFMLDTNLSYGTIYGKLSKETLGWLEEQLKACSEAGDIPIAAGHHNLILHNPLFTLGYLISNNSEVQELFEKYGVTVYFSGHIHTQHISSDENVTDIVNESFAVYPHRYGYLSIGEDGWNYESRTTDVAGYAQKAELSDENLLNYEDYGFNFFYNNAYNQAKGRLTDLITDPDKLEEFSVFSAKANVYYFGGTLSMLDTSAADEFYKSAAGTRWGEYINIVVQDTSDQLSCSYQNETE